MSQFWRIEENSLQVIWFPVREQCSHNFQYNVFVIVNICDKNMFLFRLFLSTISWAFILPQTFQLAIHVTPLFQIAFSSFYFLFVVIEMKMNEGIDISAICDVVMSTLNPFLVNVRTFLLVLLLPFCMKFMSKALLHTCTYQSWSINLSDKG